MSWALPLGVVFGVPLGVFGAMVFVWHSGAANDVYSSIGLILLVGLIAKNAILIVEFAAQQRREGKSIREAAHEAAHLRLRPILMTAFAFILGVVPLMLSSGAGAASRVSLGTAVFGGMLIGTILGVLVVPSFYVVFQGISEWWSPVPAVPQAATRSRKFRQETEHAEDGGAFGDSGSLLAGCMLGPDYQRPAVPVPAQYRSAEQPAPGREAVSLADMQWFALFQDERLQALIRTALENNYDVRIAVTRVLEAQAQLGVTRSFLLPTIDGTPRWRDSASRRAYPYRQGFPRRQHLCAGARLLNWEADVWGRIRRETEAARADCSPSGPGALSWSR